ncbi:type II toxin-antitoxin system HicA family toxin [bacterium]|nr:type II toxin-antitoxin system HicA family toxin [bacterium]
MNPPLPVVSGKLAIKVFLRLGYARVSQKGSHVKLRKSGSTSLSIPLHKELDAGLLRSLIRDAGISVDEFLEML